MNDFPLSNSMLISPREVSFSAWLGHIPFASWLVEQLQPQSIVELGTHRGSSFLAFCQAVQEQGQTTRVFAIDTWEGDEHAGYYGDEIYNTLRDYQQRNYAGISEMLRMRFNEALPYFADGSVDLLHIDGLHTYDAVREDFESWLPKLSDRAVVIFHDTCVRERGFGVWQYWSEISRQYPAFEFTHTHGLGVLLVGRQHVPALADLAARAGAGGFAPINRLFDVLGSNIKRAEEIERVQAGLTDARSEVNRLGTLGHELQQRCLQLEQEVRDGRERVRLAEEQLQLQRQQAEQSAVTMEGLRRVVAEERTRSTEDVQALLSTQLDAQKQKLDKLLRPWWRR
ncbi:class I SAM-dependent methyltransferase [Stenotrophomonas sp. 24(2023)]|uniref:class I SAM-dependent methyltransferase n=1 Tax=Stenotrophomonas sp. 24(2023) TaxID=3068324 RepID=UPI0027E106F9|nr:class I SAM-dependent methyltransferase [Stenotrophomonas sp. 24(2023)]WMJ67728.1 class I SAM-dependent methyltransferase [Stenotrophomonas sp. 24(2023)]